MLKAQLHYSHTSFESKPNIPSFFFLGGWGQLWIQLQVTHLTLSPSFGLKHRLFMNFVRLVHILYSIRPYENRLIKELKHKNQCPIYKASPTYFGKILFSWKTYLNLYLKWAMTFRSPHLFSSSFFFLEIFFFKWPSFISTHQSLLFVPLQSPSWMFTLFLHEDLPLVSKVWSNFIFHSQMALAPSLSQLVQKDFIF